MNLEQVMKEYFDGKFFVIDYKRMTVAKCAKKLNRAYHVVYHKIHQLRWQEHREKAK